MKLYVQKILNENNKSTIIRSDENDPTIAISCMKKYLKDIKVLCRVSLWRGRVSD